MPRPSLSILNICLKLLPRLSQSAVPCSFQSSSTASSYFFSTSSCCAESSFRSKSHPLETTTALEEDIDRSVDGEDGGMKLDMDLIQHLERISLVHFENEDALRRLEEAVQFANTLFEVDTTGVQPLTSILEDESLHLREDKVEPTNRTDILANASITEEDYFVAPPGNIPLESSGPFTNRNK